jgi:hypothetical protein
MVAAACLDICEAATLASGKKAKKGKVHRADPTFAGLTPQFD